MSNGNMDLLTQAITQRPPHSPKSPPIAHNSAPYNPRKADKGNLSPPSVTAGESRVNARRNNLLSQIQTIESDFAKKKDRFFHEQLRQLQEDLSRLHEGTHVGFNNGVSDLMDIRNEALYIAREEGLHKIREAEEDYEREINAANSEFETTRTTLKNDLLTHLTNKRKRLDMESSLTDISLSTTLEAPPSPSIGSHNTTGSRKLRHRVPIQVASTASYPPTALTSKSALDEVLETLSETIRARHWKPTQQPLNEDRVRDRLEREREKLVKTMLVGAASAEIDADLAEIKRRHVKKGANSVPSATGGLGLVPATTQSGSKKVKA